MLPEKYQDLEVFAAKWCLDTQDERQRQRRASTPEELRRFYAAMMPRLREILEDVDRFPLGEIPESHRAIFSLALSHTEIAPNVELYAGSPAVPHAFEESRMKARHGSEKNWAGHQSRPTSASGRVSPVRA
jgi:hypothetical protein